jgi:hypothetical protein
MTGTIITAVKFVSQWHHSVFELPRPYPLNERKRPLRVLNSFPYFTRLYVGCRQDDGIERIAPSIIFRTFPQRG